MREQFLWAEKYRPRTINDCVLPENIKASFLGILEQKEIPNLLLCGSAGQGKTTVAKALCDELGCDTLIINGSEENGIEVLRTKVKQFASSVSLANNDSRKIVILDEADYLSPATQPALRGFIEEFSANCGFIFTCNFKNKIISPLHSRCSVIDFRVQSGERKGLMLLFAKRLFNILKDEGVEFEKSAVLDVLKKFFPDYRRILNELQRYSSVNGTIDAGISSQGSNLQMSLLIKALKSKKYDDVRGWVVESLDNDPSKIYREIYDNLREHMDKQNYPGAVLILADYQYKSAFVADQELNLLACLTEILINCELK